LFNICIIRGNMIIDKKTQIMNHAINLFADKGFEGTSIRDLAKAAEVNVAMVNYYFGSKEKLVEAIIEEKSSYMKDRIEELESNTSLNDLDRINALIEDYVNRILSGASFHKFLHKELMDTKREEIHAFLNTSFTRNINNFARIIERGIENKTFKPVDTKLTVVSIIGCISQVVSSKNMCNMIMGFEDGHEPYTNIEFKNRLIKHIQNMIHAHLLPVAESK